MTIGSILGWMLCGLIVGLMARVLLPGRHNVGLLYTMLLGIAGAFVGGLLYWFIRTALSDAPVFEAWPGWIAAIASAVVILWVYGALSPRRWWQ